MAVAWQPHGSRMAVTFCTRRANAPSIVSCEAFKCQNINNLEGEKIEQIRMEELRHRGSRRSQPGRMWRRWWQRFVVATVANAGTHTFA